MAGSTMGPDMPPHPYGPYHSGNEGGPPTFPGGRRHGWPGYFGHPEMRGYYSGEAPDMRAPSRPSSAPPPQADNDASVRPDSGKRRGWWLWGSSTPKEAGPDSSKLSKPCCETAAAQEGRCSPFGKHGFCPFFGRGGHEMGNYWGKSGEAMPPFDPREFAAFWRRYGGSGESPFPGDFRGFPGFRGDGKGFPGYHGDHSGFPGSRGDGKGFPGYQGDHSGFPGFRGGGKGFPGYHGDHSGFPGFRGDGKGFPGYHGDHRGFPGFRGDGPLYRGDGKGFPGFRGDGSGGPPFRGDDGGIGPFSGGYPPFHGFRYPGSSGGSYFQGRPDY